MGIEKQIFNKRCLRFMKICNWNNAFWTYLS